MFDLISMGELLIDFTEIGWSENGQRLFEQNPGGAVANVACAAARLGLKTAFLGKVGNDSQGRFLAETLKREGVDTGGLLLTEEAFTTLAFVSLSTSGEREFSFARKPGADLRIRAEELNEQMLGSCRVLHVGSLSMTAEPAREATLHAIRTAKKSGARISYDANYRAPLWGSEEEARIQMRSLLPYADYVKLSEEETRLLTGSADPESALELLLEQGASVAVITLGKRGAILGAGHERAEVPTFSEEPVVDTTGAGDAFWGALLYCLLSESTPQVPVTGQLEEYGRFANAAATLCVGKRGAIPALPVLSQIQTLLTRKK